MSKKHYSFGYKIYGCEDCGKGFKIWLENGLAPMVKPIPMAIECPFCHGFSCYDRSFDVHRVPGIHRIKTNEPYFANIPGEAEGTPKHTEFAKVEYVKPDQSRRKERAEEKAKCGHSTATSEAYDSLFGDDPELSGK